MTSRCSTRVRLVAALVVLAALLPVGPALASPVSPVRAGSPVRAPALGPEGRVEEQAPVRLALRGGQDLVVERDPFRLRLLDRSGRTTLATVPGVRGAPVRVPGVDGPMPVEPLGAAGAFPAVGFVVGAAPALSWPLPLYTGNRMLGAEAGAVVSLVQVVDVAVTDRTLALEVLTDAPSLGPARLLATRLPGGGVRVEVEPPAGLTGLLAPVSSLMTWESPEDEALYGLGARKDAFDQRGLLRNVWVEEQNASDERVEPLSCATLGCDYTAPNGAQAAYLVQPSLHGSRGWTAWTGGTDLGRLDLAASDPGLVRWGVASARLEVHLAGGGLVRSALAHTADVGRAPAPPAWVYEPWVDVINEGEGEAALNGGGFSGGQRVREDLELVVAEHERLDLPLGVLGVEGWQEVPGARSFFGGLRDRGLRLSAYWNPFHSPGNAGYEEAASRDLFIEAPGGAPYPFVNNRGALTFAVDWTKPGAEDFWDEQLQRSMRLGFEGWMHDFGEFVTEGMRFADGTPPETMHNRYPVLLHRAAGRAADAYAADRRGFEPFFYVRSGYDGVQRSTGSVFPGDETTDWAQGSGLPSVVPTMLNLVLGGFPTFTTDVGGYFDFLAPRTTPELLVRWGQLAALTPVMRVHNSTSNGQLYPHELDGEHLDAWRRYSRLKQHLVPLVDRLTRRAAAGRGLGPVLPLVLVDDSPLTRSVDDQWLLGRDLLVAPVLEPGATTREVVLPRGRWRRATVSEAGRPVPGGPLLRGGRTVEVPVTLADIPLYVRVR